MTEMADAADGPTPPPWASQIKITHAILIGIIFLAAFTRIWRLDQPTDCYFDEVYFPTTAAKILHGNDKAWDFIDSENTHPPLSKDLIAVGEFVFGHRQLVGENPCYDKGKDPEIASNPSYAYDAFGYRFPGALAGIFSVIFMYLLAKRLLKSELAALVSAFLLSIDGLVLAQSRIATPDTFTLCFLIGSLYFVVSKRWFLSGVFLGLAASSKWNGAFVLPPIVIFFTWEMYLRWRTLGNDSRLREAERVLVTGAVVCALGVVAAAGAYLGKGGLSETVVLAGGLPIALGAFIIAGGLVAMLTEPTLRALPRARLYLTAIPSFPLFFLAVPFAVYMATYIPMFINGEGLHHWWDLNRSAYEFHSSLTATHPSESSIWSWPFDVHPVFLYSGSDNARIYNLGNPIIFWMAIPSLLFCLWRGLWFVRARVEAGAHVRIWGWIGEEQFVPLFIAVSYLALWLGLVTQGRALFLYHYQPALAGAVLALGYTVSYLWVHPHPMARRIAIGFLVAAFAAFIYFFPHWTGMGIPGWLNDSYYWFPTWR